MNPGYSLSKPYSKGFYNKFDSFEQWIRISEGCPNQCLFCAETWDGGKVLIYYEVQELVCNVVNLLDMNLMYKGCCVEIP